MTRRPNIEARARILRTAYELFATEGYDSVSMDRVAEKAGLKKANLFHYYRSKDALGAAVVGQAALRSAEAVRELFSDEARDPAEAVGGLFEWGTAGLRKDCSRGCFIGKMGQELDGRHAAMRRSLARCLSDWRGDIVAFLDAWRKRGYFRPGFKAEEAADGILALYEGGLLLAKVAEDARPALNARRTATVVIAAWKA